MAHGDGTAIHIGHFGVKVQILHITEHHRSKRLIDLPQIDIGRCHTGLGEAFFRRGSRACQHDDRVGSQHRGGHDATTRFQIEVGARLFAANHDRAGAIDDPGRVTGGVNVVDAIEGVVLGENHVVKTHTARHLKGRLQASKALDGGVRFNEIVALQNGHATAVFDRHHRAVKPAVISALAARCCEVTAY